MNLKEIKVAWVDGNDKHMGMAMLRRNLICKKRLE